MGELLKECYWSNWWRRLGGEQTDKLQVATFLYLWSWFPKKVESEQVAQLMKNDLKYLGNLYKRDH